MQTQTGRTVIPIKFSDLSRFAAGLRIWRDDQHGHDHHEHGFHVLELRRRVLGLFWTDYRIELDSSLRDEPELLAEVLWSEGAHAIDQAMLTDKQRMAINRAFHGGSEDQHTWWEVSDYSREYGSLLGEAFMAGICQAYTDIEPTILLTHAATEDVGRQIRRIVTPELADAYSGCRWSKVFHVEGAHRWLTCSFATWPTKAAAVAAGRRPCRRCRP